ncbi:MAG: class I SAM-dependent methyltransferase [Alphaproteobacteria bacterium]|nr:class I SAM-dependent methyltransferase [Alphaproteobacteria bacterium]
MASQEALQRHYASDGIAPRILAALRAQLGDVPVTPALLAPLDHFHGRGLAATEEMAALLAPRPDEHLLDIGSGIGGPARWLAATFGCRVSGIDLTREFCQAAEALNEATGLSERVRICQGDALDLPFPADSFDKAYSQNVVMNIAVKRGFYVQALRVLRPGGLLALSNLAQGPAGQPYYPTPWSPGPDTSFLSSAAATESDLKAAGFLQIYVQDRTDRLRAFYDEQRERLKTHGPPKLGVHVLMGERIKEYQRNVARSVEEGRLLALEITARKAAA